jgi:hypothetical protein
MKSEKDVRNPLLVELSQTARDLDTSQSRVAFSVVPSATSVFWRESTGPEKARPCLLKKLRASARISRSIDRSPVAPSYLISGSSWEVKTPRLQKALVRFHDTQGKLVAPLRAISFIERSSLLLFTYFPNTCTDCVTGMFPLTLDSFVRSSKRTSYQTEQTKFQLGAALRSASSRSKIVMR